MDISVVIPLYKCEKYVEELTDRLQRVLTGISEEYEIIYINDSSPENDWKIVQDECSKDIRVKGICLSRNFGQHYAITAGLKHASGKWIVVMDGDLQDKPEEIVKLYNFALGGYDIVCGQRQVRKDTFIKRLGSRLFYKLFNYLTSTRQDPSIANFGIYHRKVVDAILDMGDVIRYFPTMVQWVGFRSSKIPIEHAPRLNGTSSYNLRSLLELAFNNMISFSEKPLRLTVKIGFFISFVSSIGGIVYGIVYFLGGIRVTGFASLIISIWFLSGIIISILGILGLYIGKVFQQVKDRPNFIIDDKINL